MRPNMSVAGKTETFNIFGTRQFISWLIKKKTNSKKQTNKKKSKSGRSTFGTVRPLLVLIIAC